MTINSIEDKLNSIEFKETNFKEILDELKILKSQSNSDGDEPLSKKTWILESICNIQKNYFEAFDKMQNEQYYDAWRLFEEIEVHLLFLKRHFSIDSDLYYLQTIERFVSKYQSLFPYKLFLSTEIIEKKRECSICRKEFKIRDSCGHITGEIYGGELCVWEVTDFEFIGYAIVENPVHKYAVLFSKNPRTNETLDNYDYSVIKYLMGLITTPFEDWESEYVIKYINHKHFEPINLNVKCPCQMSEKTYGECCLKQPGVKTLFLEFIVNQPSNKIVWSNDHRRM